MKRLTTFVRVRWTMLVRSVKARAIPALINTLNNDDGYDTAYSLMRLVKVLGERGDKRAIPVLIEVLGDNNLDFFLLVESSMDYRSLRLETAVALLKLSRSTHK